VQVRIGLEAGPDRWRVDVAWGPDDAPVTQFDARTLGHSPRIAPGGVLASDPDHDLLAGDDPEALRALTERVASLDTAELKPGDLVAYGRLLFMSVLAPVWEAIVEAAPANELVELALRLPSEPPMQLALWELLHDGTNFLVTHPQVDVAMSRRIPATAPTPEPIRAPARVIFAIGSELSDPNVRAGMEFLGLMRELERSGLRIASYVVPRASVGRITDAVKRFKPDVVHFIAHGGLTSKLEPVLRMRPEEDRPGAPPVTVNAEQLFGCVMAGPRKPPIVVLAACDTGAVSSVLGMPIAEDLVRRGVPVAIAMAGSVGDRACRLFTRRFGTVLASGGSLLRAVADGRLAAYRASGPPSATIDWALPSVFLANDIDHEYTPLASENGVSVRTQITDYDFAEGPVFCARGGFWDRYDELVAEGGLNVLALYSTGDLRGLGKTRILREFGTRALLDGHVPCVVGLDGRERPTDARRFAEALLLAIAQARRTFKVDPPPSSALLRWLASPDDPPPIERPWRDWLIEVRNRFDEYRKLKHKLNEDNLGDVIVSDLAALIEAAREGPDCRIGAASRVVVLLDCLEEWGDTVDLLVTKLLDQHGLGDSEEQVPVVLAFRTGADRHQQNLTDLVTSAPAKPWLGEARIEPLAEGDEEGLAYRWILLNANPAIAPPISEQVYTVATSDDGQWRKLFGFITKRIPARLGDSDFYGAAKFLLETTEELTPGGDDNKALADLIEARA
jgi:CHAT domain